MTDPNELRDLIVRLTETHDITVTDPGGRRIGTRTQQPLLAKLRTAKTSNIGTGAGTAGFGPKTTLNIAASELYTSIERRARRWALNSGWTRGTAWPSPETLLTIWHSRTYLARDLDPFEQTLRNWVHAITDLTVDPPHRFPLDAPCPFCGERWVEKTTDGILERRHALNVIEREPVNDSTSFCLACDTIWPGIDGARDLARLIDDRAYEQAAS